jgi:hypothetical protein
MFENVVSAASGFTRPFIVSTNYFDGEAESTCTSCLVLGDSGYVLVPASSIEVKRVAEVHAPELSAGTKTYPLTPNTKQEVQVLSASPSK